MIVSDKQQCYQIRCIQQRCGERWAIQYIAHARRKYVINLPSQYFTPFPTFSLSNIKYTKFNHMIYALFKIC